MLKQLFVLLCAMFAAAAFGAVDVNKATQAELEALKGIGPGIAGKILDERKRGSFKDWADFVGRVKGVSEGNAAKFSADGLTVGGAAFKGAAAAPAAPAAKKDDDRPRAAASAASATQKAEVKPHGKAVAKDDKKTAADKPAAAASAAKK